MNTENNKLIADFLNWKLGSDTSKENYHVPEQFWYWNVKQALDKDINLYDMDDHSYCHVNDMLFNVSFDWLLPVWEKIEYLGYAVIVEPDAVRIIDYNTEDKSYMGGKFICMGSRLTIDQTLIGAFNICFLQFIHLYNQKQTENETD